jgi:type II secretory pathway component PulC
MGFLVSGLVIGLLSVFLLLRNTANIEAMEEFIPPLSSSRVITNEINNTPDRFVPSKVSQSGISKKGKVHLFNDFNSLENLKDELKNIKALPRLQLDLRLAGTVLLGKEASYALIVDEISGKQNLYSVGASIKGAKILKIGKTNVVFEKAGKAYVLKVVKGSYTVPIPPEKLKENGPLHTKVTVELPYFEPVFNKTGPPIDSEDFYENLPEFEPYENDSGPSGV